jgi:hypothetical protein
MRVHGTNSMYHGGCKCFHCKVAHSRAEKDRRERRKAGVTERKIPALTAIRPSVDRMLELAAICQKRRSVQANVVSACEKRKIA